MEIENVTGIGFAARGTAEDQRHLTVGDRMLGEVVVEDDRMPAVVPIVFRHGDPGIGSKELQGGGVGGPGVDDDGVLHRSVLFQLLHQRGDGGLLLADGHIDTDDVLALLVDDRVDRQSGFTGLTVPDDQLPLSAADGNQRVDRFDTGLERFMDRFPRHDAGGFLLDETLFARLDGAFAVDGLSQRVDDTTDQAVSHRNFEKGTQTLDAHPLTDIGVFSEDDDPDTGLLQVQDLPPCTVFEFDHFTGHDVAQAVDRRDPVTDPDNLPHFVDIYIQFEIFDPFLDNGTDLIRLQFRCHCCSFL